MTRFERDKHNCRTVKSRSKRRDFSPRKKHKVEKKPRRKHRSRHQDLSEGEIVSDDSFKNYKNNKKIKKNDENGNLCKEENNCSKSDDNISHEIELMELDEEKILEERRLARQKISEKYKQANELVGITAFVCRQEDESTHLHEIPIKESKDEGSPLKEESDEVLIDIFADDDTKFHESQKNVLCLSPSKRKQINFTNNINKNRIDNKDDAEGYYVVQIGEVFDHKFKVYGYTGSGVFSSVVRAREISDSSRDVAIKIIRNNDLMLKQGLKELEIMKKLNETDPNDTSHCLRLIGNFYHLNHLCLILEPLSLNLRELIKKYGAGIGLNIKAVRSYSYQLFLALRLLSKCNIIHADIKPDNILVTENRLRVKLSDFGSAFYTGETIVTPYLVSRFYRAPEIILGRAYDCSVDIWSLGCTMFELYTGHFLFPGNTNNEMIRLFMELKGKIPHKILRKSQFASKHFDFNLNFVQHDFDVITQKEKLTIVTNVVQKTDLLQLILSRSVDATAEVRKKLTQLKDLLEKILVFDHYKRIAVDEALLHPFIQEKI